MKQRILIYEGMNGHGECLSPYYYYFSQLGLDIDVCIKDKVAKENPLWMIKDKYNLYVLEKEINQYPEVYNEHLREAVQKIPHLFEYDYYLITTLNRRSYPFILFLLKNGVTENQILFQNHIDYPYYMAHTKNNTKLLNGGFVLGKCEEFPSLPSVKNLVKGKPCRTENFDKLNIFISGLDHIHFNNFEKFVKVVEELNKKGFPINLRVTGVRRKGDYELPESKYITYLGRINFKEMYEEYIHNDFLLVLFDKNSETYNDDHQTFLRGRLSGSRNGSIMYQIPLLVQKPYQEAWGLSEENSISYENNEYKELLKKIFNMSYGEYNKIVDNLLKLQNKETELGLKNVKDKINFLRLKCN